MKMKSVVIRTRDIKKSIDFYEKIMGFKFETMISPEPGKQIAFLTDPETCGKLELLYNERAKSCDFNGVSITFNVNQIGEAEKHLIENSVRIISNPKTIKGGKKIMTALDPNGVELDFIEEKI